MREKIQDSVTSPSGAVLLKIAELLRSCCGFHSRQLARACSVYTPSGCPAVHPGTSRREWVTARALKAQSHQPALPPDTSPESQVPTLVMDRFPVIPGVARNNARNSGRCPMVLLEGMQMEGTLRAQSRRVPGTEPCVSPSGIRLGHPSWTSVCSVTGRLQGFQGVGPIK